jgi:hypothetical protein
MAQTAMQPPHPLVPFGEAVALYVHHSSLKYLKDYHKVPKVAPFIIIF